MSLLTDHRGVAIDHLCEEALKLSGFLDLRRIPIEIELFIERVITRDIGYETLPSGVLGYSVFFPNGQVRAIRVSRAIEDGTISGERIARATWAHEAGHCLLHAKLLAARRTSGTPEVTRTSMRLEREANRAMAALLLPRSLVIETLRSAVPASAFTVDKAQRVLTNRFHVSRTLARIRLEEILSRPEANHADILTLANRAQFEVGN